MGKYILPTPTEQVCHLHLVVLIGLHVFRALVANKFLAAGIVHHAKISLTTQPTTFPTFFSLDAPEPFEPHVIQQTLRPE